MMWVPALACLLAMGVHGADHLPGGPPRFKLRNNDELNIVGGGETAINTVPSMVGLLVKDFYTCGGTIITNTRILSAAHCAEYKLKQAGYGASLKEDLIKTQIITKWKHPLFVSYTLDYDVAVFAVDPPIHYSVVASPINMVDSGEKTEDNTKVMVAGWGRTTTVPSSERPSHLMAASLVVINHRSCQNVYWNEDNLAVSDRMLCAGVYRGNVAPCKGDSGGPLINMATKKLVGIVSWSHIPCADPKFPGVYVDIAHKEVRKFIKTYTGK